MILKTIVVMLEIRSFLVVDLPLSKCALHISRWPAANILNIPQISKCESMQNALFLQTRDDIVDKINVHTMEEDQLLLDQWNEEKHFIPVDEIEMQSFLRISVPYYLWPELLLQIRKI